MKRKRAQALCSWCRDVPPIQGQGHCKNCHAVYMREWRKRKKAEAARKDQELQTLRALTRTA